MQEKKTKELPFSSIFDFKVENRGKNSYPKYYGNGWSFMNSCSGFWYYLFPKDKSLRNYYVSCGDVCEIYCEDERSIKPTNHCLPDELAEYVSKLDVAIGLKKEHRQDFERVVDYFLSKSPVNMIMFLPRWQGEERDIVHGVISRDQFFSMMLKEQIRLNMCYIISSHIQ
jgi:hypothetical protein